MSSWRMMLQAWFPQTLAPKQVRSKEWLTLWCDSLHRKLWHSNFSFALSGSPPVCKGHLQLHLLHLLLLSSWCVKAETTLCEWRAQTPPLESDYNKHFSLLPHALPNTRVLLEQAFTSASLPALLDLRPLTSFKIRGWRTRLLPLVFTQQVEGWAAPVVLLERLLRSRAAKVDWHVKFPKSYQVQTPA